MILYSLPGRRLRNAVLCCMLASCEVGDLREEYIALADPAGSFASTIFLGNFIENGFARYGSAIIVDDTHLLTNQHMWAEGDAWYERPLPAEKELVLFGELGLQQATFKLVAAGDARLHPGEDPVSNSARRGRSDWVMIETDQPNWKVPKAAPIHRAAFNLDWAPQVGDRLYVAGFASYFMSSELKTALEQGGIMSDLSISMLSDFIRSGPYLLQGESLTIEGIPEISTTQIDRAPFGHSGGGVYLWNESSRRMELLGIFHSWVTTTHTEPSAVLGYAPIAGLPVPWWEFNSD